MGTPKIKSATSFRNNLYETLKEVSRGHFHIITHEIVDEKESLQKMAIGLAQIEQGKGVPHKKALKKLEALKKKWK